MAGTAAVVFARWAGDALLRVATDGAPSLVAPIDVRVLAFAASVALLSVVVFGVWPAWRATRVDPVNAFRGNARTMTGHGARPARALVVLQVALSLMLGGSSKFLVAPSGNIGIGVAPGASEKLRVAGNVVVDGNIGAKYQDVAEWVETSVPLEAGTVVIVDPARSNRVLRSARAYDTRVAGAVSAQPGLVLGERTEGKVTVAQSGRVRVKVDASRGAIRIGDLLVTSPTPGYAMRSRPMLIDGKAIHRPGTLLGKALEPLPAGKGEILVLLTLQ